MGGTFKISHHTTFTKVEYFKQSVPSSQSEAVVVVAVVVVAVVVVVEEEEQEEGEPMRSIPPGLRGPRS